MMIELFACLFVFLVPFCLLTIRLLVVARRDLHSIEEDLDSRRAACGRLRADLSEARTERIALGLRAVKAESKLRQIAAILDPNPAETADA